MKIAIKATHITCGGELTHLNKMIEWFARIVPEREFVVLGKSGQEKLLVEAPRNFDYRFFRFNFTLNWLLNWLFFSF